MKPTKSKKKPISETKPSSSIHNYFKTGPNESSRVPNVKSVYVDAVLNKLKSFDDERVTKNDNNADRENDVPALTTTPPTKTTREENNKSNRQDLCQAPDDTNGCSDCENWRKKYKEMEKRFLKLSVCHSELTMKHKDLVRLLTTNAGSSDVTEQFIDRHISEDLDLVSTGTARAHSDTDSFVDQHTSADLAPVSTGQNSSSIFKISSVSAVGNDIFTDDEITNLKKIALTKNRDSTFILSCVQYAYKENLASLTSKTLKGTRGKYEVKEGKVITIKPPKDPLTPEKVARIQQLFIDRIARCKCVATESGERVNQLRFNELIANAVRTVTNKQAPQEVRSNQNADLNL
ncbi:uncharacterized protein LOC119080943 isoform X1 [Bradysia coprophila]|uniref:uncharacterized protein LOC119080943 isoform X1 n=1 Tax=Bradysia coprophila TaxID=38358 RepID=UPI00187DBE67|nr:uncharacterized protein LOC119080943 isoform X1 [Bradysia coprophila]XP_037045465.1 uncharacterized protein LOC119080943 isoform X1 [Bradysia coprophila]